MPSAGGSSASCVPVGMTGVLLSTASVATGAAATDATTLGFTDSGARVFSTATRSVADTASCGVAEATVDAAGRSASWRRAELFGASDCTAPSASVSMMTGKTSSASERRSSREGGRAEVVGAARGDGVG